MATITLCRFEELPDWVNRELLSDNGSGGMEYASGVADYLQQQGINLNDEDALANLTQEQISAALGYAKTRAGIIGTIDAATGGLVSRNLIPTSMVRGFAAREAAKATQTQDQVARAKAASVSISGAPGTTVPTAAAKPLRKESVRDTIKRLYPNGADGAARL